MTLRPALWHRAGAAWHGRVHRETGSLVTDVYRAYKHELDMTVFVGCKRLTLWPLDCTNPLRKTFSCRALVCHTSIKCSRLIYFQKGLHDTGDCTPSDKRRGSISDAGRCPLASNVQCPVKPLSIRDQNCILYPQDPNVQSDKGGGVPAITPYVKEESGLSYGRHLLMACASLR